MGITFDVHVPIWTQTPSICGLAPNARHRTSLCVRLAAVNFSCARTHSSCHHNWAVVVIHMVQKKK